MTVWPPPEAPRGVMFAGQVSDGAAGCGAGSFGLRQADSDSARLMTLQCASVWRVLRCTTADYSAPIPR